MGRTGHFAGALLVAQIGLQIGTATAQEYCAACTGPNGLYRCIIEGAQPRGGQSLQMLCVTAMAKQGGHATCTVKRGTVFDCDGTVKRIPWTALDAPARQEERPVPPAPAPPKAQPTAGPAPSPATEAPPQTVLDLAKQANEKAAEQVKKAGDTVKDATKKTWDCMFSFFTRC
jgi:hypothetical protein